MERNAVIAAALSLAVLLVWQYLILRPIEEKRVSERQAQQAARKKEPAAPPLASPAPAPAAPPASAAAEKSAAAGKEELVRVDAGVAVFEFTNRGAGLVSARLTRYLTDKGQPVELAPGGSPRLRPLYFWGGPAAERLNAAPFRVEGSAPALTPGRPQGEVRFVYRGPGGLAAEKALSFRHGSYAVSLRVKVEGAQGPIGIALGPEAGGSDGNTYGGVIEGPMSYVGKKLLYDAPEAGKPVAHKAEVRWTALQSKHFLMALVPRGGTQGAEAHFLREKDGGVKEYAVVVPLAGGEAALDFYAGPKETERLAALKVNLEDSLDYGIFSFISRPLMAVLRALHAVSGNWGVAIILLTVLVKIIFYPLTHVSMRNMKEMQKLQPRMEQLRTLYKDDRGKLNEQVMALYREHKVNPMMGCLPMVIQIPVFFGLYEALLVSIELRQAPFFGWVQDLSVQEPYHVYTILMGASMYLQQKMTPTPADPTQAKMMMFMPVVFTGMFIYYPVPVGLVIYWLVNNVLSIAQQYYVNRSVKPPKLAEGS